jgi:hypothetical protein
MSANPHTADHASRDFTVAEVEQMGRALTPHFRLVVTEVVDKAVEPLRAEMAGQRARSGLIAAATGFFTSLGAIIVGRWHA